ncbi:hypothetical protein ACIQXD_29515 [Streptomyces uncialis]|uniref:hypothetical protein n=1 Tax=Streptomyces uncialis TaxID=1048205 RepID=UPI0037F6C5D3
MTDTEWVHQAPCAAVPGFVLPEGSRSTDMALIRKASLAMDHCQTCPYRSECIDLVQPGQAGFDGIAGGRLWINGHPVSSVTAAREDELTEPALRATCGTDSGWLQHRRRGERPCPGCRSGKWAVAQAKKHRAPTTT